LEAQARELFAARLRGPAEARAAVLAALEGAAPYPLARIAVLAGPDLGIPLPTARRLGLLVEVVRVALAVCGSAYRSEPLPERLDRAMRVLVADTLLTFAWELAADLSEPAGTAVRHRLARDLGAGGFLQALASGGGPRADPERAASVLLGGVLLDVAEAARPEEPLDPGIMFEIRLAASFAGRGSFGVLLPDGTIAPRLDRALGLWRAFASAHAGGPPSRAKP
jgi:hypothetical protein